MKTDRLINRNKVQNNKNKMNLKILSVILILSLFISGCNVITGDVTADLEDNDIRNGETTKFTISGKNTGNQAINVIFSIIPEDPAMIKISYSGSLESNLQPEEETTKVLGVQGFTQYTSSEYTIEVQLINKDNGKVLGSEIKKIKVRK